MLLTIFSAFPIINKYIIIFLLRYFIMWFDIGYDTMMMVDCREGVVGAGNVTGGSSPPSLLREQFAKVCFETLLQFSLVEGISSSSSPSSPSQNEPTAPDSGGSNDCTADAELITGKLAVTALLHRFQEVVEKFCHDQNLTGKCPLPR